MSEARDEIAMCENHIEAAPPHVPYGIIIAFLAVIAFWIAVLAAASGAFAQPYQLPPVIQPYYPPPPAPFVELGAGIGGLISMPFQILTGIFGAITTPVLLVPDGAGGWVSFYNPRVMPDGSLRSYDPALDGYPPGYARPPLEPLQPPPATMHRNHG